MSYGISIQLLTFRNLLERKLQDDILRMNWNPFYLQMDVLTIHIYIYIYMCVCVCVYVCEETDQYFFSQHYTERSRNVPYKCNNSLRAEYLLNFRIRVAST
jgi:hypothetical protein